MNEDVIYVVVEVVTIPYEGQYTDPVAAFDSSAEANAYANEEGEGSPNNTRYEVRSIPWMKN